MSVKKVIATIATSLGMVVLLPAATFAASAKTDISGVVTNNGHTVAGAKVTVVCDNHSKKDTTDANGSYLVQFPAANCPDGSKATVVATKGGLGGVNSKNVTAQTTKLNVAIVNVSLPEFGVVAGIGAAVVGGGAVVAIRRKQLGQN